MNATLDRVLAEATALPLDQLLQLRNALDNLLATRQAHITEEEFEQRLIAMGIISKGDAAPTDLGNFAPIEVIGKPVSETIIEERR